MELIVCEGEGEFVETVSEWCRTQIQQYHAQSVFIPAGRTPESLYQYWEESHPPYLKGLKLIQIDDVLTGDKRHIFKKFFKQFLPSYQQAIQWIEDGEVVGDIALLGLGLNGHIAFHEPGVSLTLFSGCVNLGTETCKNLGIREGEWGISYGLAACKKSKAILIIVKGATKKEILKRLLSGDKTLPASHLMQHPNLTIIADSDAVS